ncbi:MAG: TatD family hydrolase [Candidatus Nanohaloarchaea archaeon]
MKPVDTHCHLDFEAFDEDRKEVIDRCGERLEFVVNAGREPESNRKSIELEEENDCVVANLGLHPTHTGSFDEIDTVKQQVREHDPAAVGEIGLDHHHVTDPDTRNRQEEVFRQMLELARELQKPVVVHSRDAESRAVEILEEFTEDVMLHCFNGTADLAERAAGNGMYIGVTTQVLYSNRVQQIAEKIPLDRLLLETDSPFLYRGERNEPANVEESAEKIAELKGLNVEEVIRSTTASASRLFGR